jgi:hypothetical protein
MNIPNLRHFTPDGISSDPVEALVGEAWVPAIYTDKGWATADGVSLSADIAEWRHAVEAGQISSDSMIQHQGGDESGQTPKASRSNRAVKSRQVTQG